MLHPEDKLLWNLLVKTMNEWHTDLERRKPSRFPTLDFLPYSPRFPGAAPPVEQNYSLMEIEEAILETPQWKQAWWQRLKQGEYVSGIPRLAQIRYSSGRAFAIKMIQ